MDRSGGVYGGAELALLEQTGTYVRDVRDMYFFLKMFLHYLFICLTSSFVSILLSSININNNNDKYDITKLSK